MKLTLLPLRGDNVIRVRCEGNVTLRGQEGGGDPLEALVGPRCFSQTVLFDLEKAQGIDTSGISWLMRTHDRFRQSGGRLVLLAMPPLVTQALDFLHLTAQLTTAANEAAALGPGREAAHAGGDHERVGQAVPIPG